MNEIIEYISNRNKSVGQLGGNFGTVDSFFLLNQTSLKIEKAPGTKKSIYVIKGKEKSKSNTETIRYLVEYFIFLKLVDLKFAKKFSKISEIIKWMMDGNELKINQVDNYDRLADYLNENRSGLINYYSKNISEKWGTEIFYRHLKASYNYEFLGINKFKTHKNVWRSIIEGENINFSGRLAFFETSKSKLISSNNISKTLLLGAKKIAEKSTRKEFGKSVEAAKLRREFKKLLQISVINEYSREINENTLLKEFPYLEGAHIIPVYYLLKNNRLSDISNPSNGILVDPNLHKIIDTTNSYFEDNKVVLNGETMGIIKSGQDRVRFMKEFNQLRKDRKI